MINVNEKLLDQLNDSEYFLISKLMKYGKKSCPKNSVLMSITKWGDNKVKKYKKSLVDKGFLIVSKRWKILNGKRVRDSNEYLINTNLISKYRGKQESELYCFHTIEIHTDENDTNDFELDDFELYENDQGIKVLKLLIIDNNKLLIKDKEEPSIQKNKTSSFKKNTELEKPKKVAQKKGKEKHTFPDNTPSGYYDPLAELDCRENKQLPFMVACASKTLNKIFETKDQALKEYNQIYSEKATIEIIEKSWKSFIEKRFSNGHGQIRTVTLLKDAFFKWTQHQVKFDRIDGHKKRGNEKTTSKTITTTNSMLQGTYARLRKKRGGQT